MTKSHPPVLQKSLENIYISPLEQCNLHCRYCYTHKTKNILTDTQILRFIDRYSRFIHKSYFLNLKSVTFCGGEVFLLPFFPKLINKLITDNIFITIITNGTIDKLDQIKEPHNCQLLVSIDGPQEIHDANRGQGNFDKSVSFIKHALSLGFPVEIFYLVTKDSYRYIDSFNLLDLKITYLTDRLHSLTPSQTLNLKQNYPTYPSPNFGCYQLALQSDGLIYGCCESPIPLAKISDPIPKIIDNYHKSLLFCRKCVALDFSAHNECDPPAGGEPEGSEHCKNLMQAICAGCCAPDYICGYKTELNLKSCKDVVKLFNGPCPN